LTAPAAARRRDWIKWHGADSASLPPGTRSKSPRPSAGRPSRAPRSASTFVGDSECRCLGLFKIRIQLDCDQQFAMTMMVSSVKGAPKQPSHWLAPGFVCTLGAVVFVYMTMFRSTIVQEPLSQGNINDSFERLNSRNHWSELALIFDVAEAATTTPSSYRISVIFKC
jgi:hypothetical protein